MPNYPSALYLLALIERQANNIERSTSLLRKVVTLEPHNSAAQCLLGRNLLRLGRTKEAVSHFRLALESDPQSGEALHNLAETLRRVGDPEAEVYLERFRALKKPSN
jgi:Flp pilus assembly protein TadD